MGCNSSDEQSAMNPGFVRHQQRGYRILPEKVRIEYFPFLGRADPLIQMFEYHG